MYVEGEKADEMTNTKADKLSTDADRERKEKGRQGRAGKSCQFVEHPLVAVTHFTGA